MTANPTHVFRPPVVTRRLAQPSFSDASSVNSDTGRKESGSSNSDSSAERSIVDMAPEHIHIRGIVSATEVVCEDLEACATCVHEFGAVGAGEYSTIGHFSSRKACENCWTTWRNFCD